MKKIIFIIVNLLIINCCLGQGLLVSENGSLSTSKLVIDTIINYDSKIVDKVYFEEIDTSQGNKEISHFLVEKYVSQLKYNAASCFFIANLTNAAIYFNRYGDRLIGQEYGRFDSLGYKPITLFIIPRCVTGIEITPLELKSGQILILKSNKLAGDITQVANENCFIKIKATNKQLISKPFKRNFSKNDFYFNSKDSLYLRQILKSRAFEH